MKTQVKSLISASSKTCFCAVGILLVAILLNSVNAQAQHLRVKMLQASTSDETVIQFQAGAAFDLDNADVLKVSGGNFEVSTLTSQNQNLAVNALPAFDCHEVVPVMVANASEGNYSLIFSEYESFSTAVAINLYDHYTNSTTSITSTPNYDFAVTSDPASVSPSRFEIEFTATAAPEDFDATAAMICEGTNGLIQITNTHTGTNYTAEFQDGTTIGPVAGNDGAIAITIPSNRLVAGGNMLEVHASYAHCQTDNHTNVNVQVVNVYKITSVKAAQRCDAGSLTLEAYVTSDDGTYRWYDAEFAATPISAQSSSTFITDSLTESQTYYVSLISALGCESPRVAVLAEITMPYALAIETAVDTLKSNYATGNQWYLNGDIIAGATGQTLIATETGTYSVVFNSHGCSDSVLVDFVLPAAQNSITAYPNPVADQVVIEVPNGDTANPGVATVFNNVGFVINVVPLSVNSGTVTGQIDMTGYPHGIYVVKVTDSSAQVLQLKLVKL